MKPSNKESPCLFPLNIFIEISYILLHCDSWHWGLQLSGSFLLGHFWINPVKVQQTSWTGPVSSTIGPFEQILLLILREKGEETVVCPQPWYKSNGPLSNPPPVRAFAECSGGAGGLFFPPLFTFLELNPSDDGDVVRWRPKNGTRANSEGSYHFRQ